MIPSYCLKIKNRSQAQKLKALAAAFAGDLAPMWWLTIIGNTSSRGSDALFWPPVHTRQKRGDWRHDTVIEYGRLDPRSLLTSWESLQMPVTPAGGQKQKHCHSFLVPSPPSWSPRFRKKPCLRGIGRGQWKGHLTPSSDLCTHAGKHTCMHMHSHRHKHTHIK